MKTLVVFISHLYNNFCVDRYHDLRRSLIDDHHLIWCHTNTPPDNFFKEHGVENDIHLEIENYFDERNMNNTQNNLIFLGIYNALPDYDYYWFIEYDVMINTLRVDPFTELFTYFNNEPIEKDADIVADHIYTYASNYNYEIRYPFDIISKDYPNVVKLNLSKNDIYFAFYTICRLSNKLLRSYSSAIDWQDLFFEWGLTTFAYLNDMKICTLLNTFTQENNKSYSPDNRHKRINNGSNSFVLKSYKRFYKEYPEGYIIHPVKSYRRFVVN